MNRLDRRRAALAGLLAAPLALALAAPGTRGPQDAAAPADGGWQLELRRPEPRPGSLPERLERADELDCGACHATIRDEWAETLHALAWVDPVYQDSLKGRRRKESCYGCHVPRPLHQRPPEDFERKPPPREDELEDRHFGISCRSCHLGDGGVVLGPWGAPTEAHASEASEHFRGTGSNALCIACHRTTIGPVIGIAKDFEAARLDERGMSCVGCHMAPVDRSPATDRPPAEGGQPLPAREGRSHLLQTPRDPTFLAQAFALEARVEGDETVVRIANRAGHRVPGLQERRIDFEARGAGATVSSRIDERSYLPVEGAIELRLPVRVDEVVVTGDHTPPGQSEAIRFLETRLTPAR